jgi:transglutaminase-like putative cysteine protease
MNAKSFASLRGVMLIALLCAGSAAGDVTTNNYERPEFALVDPKSVLSAAADITLAKYPDCDDAIVEKKMVRVYRPDGTGECQDESFTKVLTEKGKRDNRTLALGFMLPYSTVEVAKLEIIKPDGRVLPVDVAANSKESIDDSQMQSNIYDPNVRVLRVNIPGLEIGDVVHAVARQNNERPIIPGQFSEESVFEGQPYLRHASYEVYAPKARPLKKIALRDEVRGTIKYTTHAGSNDTVVHSWEITDVPRMFSEPAMPPYEMVLQRLFVSTTPDWQTISKWYWELSKAHLDAVTPEMKELVAKLTAGKTNELETVKALFYYVSKKVRYMGLTPEKDRPGFEPHDVKITFNKQYGVCRDKAALLVSLLRAAGLKAFPVLINVGTRKDLEVPDADFNHAIVGAELTAGEYLLMDPTDENTRDLLPASDGNQSFLVCRPEGEVLKVSPISPPEDNTMAITTTGTLSSEGRLEARSHLSFGGVNDDIFRNSLVHMKPDDRRRFFERNLKQAIPGACLTSLRITPADLLDVSEPIGADLEYSVADLTASGDGKALVSVPWIGNRFGVLRSLLSSAGLDKREYPMQTWVTYGLKENISLKLGNGFGKALALPSCKPVEDDSLSYHQNCALRDGSLDCARAFALKVVEFNPQQYLRLKETLKMLDYDERKAPMFAISRDRAKAGNAIASADRPSVESNARILEVDKELDVTDAHSAVYRVRYTKQILNYAGKIREAELKIDYNPACQTVQLLRGVVISTTGQRQEVSKGEINVMDAGWNASAKRYTGGKILVANLPGVDIGSRIEVEFEVTSTNQPFLAGFEAFQLPEELESKSFRLTAPCNVTIQQLATGPAGVLKAEDKSNSSKQTFIWNSEHVAALPAESQLPPDWTYVAGVQYFAGDQKAYLSALRETMEDRSRRGDKAAAQGKKLADAAANRLDGLKAIRDFVAKSIREAGPSFTDLPLSELSAADTTLADGYGHSADRAILLHAMLTGAGFPAEFVLASGLPAIAGITNVAGAVPLSSGFTAPLVCVSLDGSTYYLNDTDQYAKLGSTGYDGKLGIVLSTQAPEIIHAASDCTDKSDTLYSLSVDDQGKTRLGVTHRYYGPEYNRKNRYFSELPPEEKKRYYQQIVSQISQGARPVGNLVTRFDTYPGVEQFAVEIDNYAVRDGKYLYFDLPYIPSLFPPGTDSRALPLLVSGHTDRSIRSEIELPPGYGRAVMQPKAQTLRAPDGCGHAQITAQNSRGKSAVVCDLQTSPAIVAPKDYAQLLDVESTLGRKSSRLFLFEKE